MGKHFHSQNQRSSPALFELDPSQRAFLELPVGQSATLLGAPGSGKTTLLVELVAQRIESGMKPEEIIVLTPHRRAASHLRDVLALRINQATQGPLARTPLSLAFALAQNAALDSGDEPPRMLTGSEQDSLIADLIQGHLAEGNGPVWPDPLVPEVRVRRAFRSELRDLFSRCTERSITPHQLMSMGQQRGFPQWEAAARFWEEYLAVLANLTVSSFDSSELLAVAATAVSNPTILPEVKMVIVDDAQELTPGMIDLLHAFASRNIPVIAAGDPDISATTFRGAKPEFLGTFAPSLTIPADHVSEFVLANVYRHGSSIRAQVSAFTQGASAAAGKQRQAHSVVEDAGSDPVSIAERPSRNTEVNAIASYLRKQHLLREIPWSNMVVVARSGSLIPRIARALSVAEVPTKTLLSENSLTDYASAVDLVTVLAIAMDRVELTSQVVSDLLQSPMVGLSSVELRRLRMSLRHEELLAGGTRTGEELLLAAMRDPRDFLSLDFPPANKARSCAQLISAVRTQHGAGDSIEELLWQVWTWTKLAQRWGTEALGSGLIAQEANHHLDGVMALFTAAKRFVERFPDRPASDFIAQLLESDVPEDTLAPQSVADSVLVATPSSLIATEFDVVVISAVQEGVWPNVKPRSSLLRANELETDTINTGPDFAAERQAALVDEKRMFALSLSRAKQSVFVTATANDDELPSVFYNKIAGSIEKPTDTTTGLNLGDQLSLRQMVGSLRRELTREIKRKSPEEVTLPLVSALRKLATYGVPGAAPAQWYGLTTPSTTAPLVDLTQADNTVSVSPSKLETWEKNQLAWFIQSISGRTSSPATGIGSIIHKAMEIASEPDSDISVEKLWSDVSQRWHELSFDAPWLSEAQRARAFAMVSAVGEYLEDFRTEQKTLLATEGGFSIQVGHAVVRGYIDRIEQDVHGRVVIVDLKTGKSGPSASEVEKHAQLACYQLAVAQDGFEVIPDSATPGGAKLLYVTNGYKGKLYREYSQEIFDEQELNQTRERIELASVGMAGASFNAPLIVSEDLGDPFSKYEFRIHTIAAVSAS